MKKIIEGFEDYIINDSGINDESVWSTKSNQFLKAKKMPNDYIQICFSVNGKHYHRYLHILLGKAFIPNPENKPEINHKNHKRDDNRLENLEWSTRPEQMDEITKENISKSRKGKHYPKLAKALKGKVPWNLGVPHSDETKEKIAQTKIKAVYQYTLDRDLVATYDRASSAEEYGFSKDCIVKCCEGKHKTHKNFIFSYELIKKENVN